MSYIYFTDATGLASLDCVAPRFRGWLPDIDVVADSHVAVGTGLTYAYEHRTDYVLDTSIEHMAADEIPVALRLKRHLLLGGECCVVTEDLDDNAYRCVVRPGAVPEMSGPDPATLHYALALPLKHVSDLPALAVYNRDGRTVRVLDTDVCAAPPAPSSDCSTEPGAYWAEEYAAYSDTADLDARVAADVAGAQGTVYWEGTQYDYDIDPVEGTLVLNYQVAGQGGMILGGYTGPYDVGPPPEPAGWPDAWSRIRLRIPATFAAAVFWIMRQSYASDDAEWAGLMCDGTNLVFRRWRDTSGGGPAYDETVLAAQAGLCDGTWREFALHTVDDDTTAWWGPRGGPWSSQAETIVGASGGIHYFDAMDDAIAVADSIEVCSYEAANGGTTPFPLS
jgi:hypothetical protein